MENETTMTISKDTRKKLQIIKHQGDFKNMDELFIAMIELMELKKEGVKKKK